MPHDNATLIAGPTASGKSSFALKIAAEKDAVIVNADSMQIYDVLRVITARPSVEEEQKAPHFLYGHVDPADAYSTGHWVDDVTRVLEQQAKDRHVVFVGGTGLYFKALLGGLSPMPEIDPAIRERWRYRLNEEGASKLHRILRAKDPEVALTLKPSDSQRIARALEVLETSGKSILWWQKQQGQSLVNSEAVDKIVLLPDRDKLKERINLRFDAMVEMGALDEVRAILSCGIDPSMPAMKAIGVPQFADFLNGNQSVQAAIERSKTASRQYAKRQMTWFRNQLTIDWKVYSPLY